MKAYVVDDFGGPEILKVAEVDKPVAKGRDVLVKISAIATNPVDTKARKTAHLTGRVKGQPWILGWDAAGVVDSVGGDVTLFKPGDEVYFAGSIVRPGSYAEYCLVDERIVGHKPKTLSMEDSAGVPLVGLTAWEAMVEQMGIVVPETENQKLKNQKKSILIVAGAGGVGSIAIQIAKKILGLQVIATASRPESIEWCKKMGADHVISHASGMKEGLKGIGFNSVDYIFNCSDIADKFDALAALLGPLGKLCCIVGTGGVPLNVDSIRARRGTFTWELMFTRPMLGVEMELQGEILNNLARLLDSKVLVSPVTKVYDNMSFLPEAHKQQESGSTIGKLVLKAIF